MEIVGNVQLVAGSSQAIESVVDLLKKEGVEVTGNPDVYVREYGSFGVDEARELALKAGSRALSSSRRIFIIATAGMTNEAQNALLKTLEEPSGDALFFFILPSPQTLLPTLRSRAQLLDIGSSPRTLTVDPQAFLSAAPKDRLDLLKPLLEKDDDEKRDVGSALQFLAALEQELASKAEKNSRALEAIYRARRYLGDKGALAKVLLEQVALLL